MSDTIWICPICSSARPPAVLACCDRKRTDWTWTRMGTVDRANGCDGNREQRLLDAANVAWRVCSDETMERLRLACEAYK